MVILLSWLFYHGERRATTARGGEDVDTFLLAVIALILVGAFVRFE